MLFVELEGVTKQYGDTTALENVSLEVHQGNFLAIVGPSGSGKSTLLRLLDLLEDPTEGHVFFDGERIPHLERDKLALRRRIGIVFQQSVMFNTTVYKNIEYPLRIRGVRSSIKKRISEVIELVRLRGFEKRRALTLSGGEMQRVSLAQALVFDPELLLLDEPTANLDPRNMSIIEETVAKVNRDQNVTVVMATHNMAQAERLAYKVGILHQGRLVEIGDVKDVFQKPSDFFANFAGLWNVHLGYATPHKEGLSLIDLGRGTVIEALTQKQGNVTVYIRPQDMIASTAAIHSSARNVLQGRIIEIADLNQQVQLKVAAGKEFTATITKTSFKDLGLTLGSVVYLSFKASAVHVL